MKIICDDLRPVSEEFSDAELGDVRLNHRLSAIVDLLGAQPGESFPEALGSEAAREGLYRFLRNDRITPDKILEPHFARTAERLVESGGGIIAHDTSIFCFLGETKRRGLGRITRAKQGFHGHFALAISGGQINRPMGVIGLETYVRDGKKKKRHASIVAKDPTRESLRWLKLVNQSEARIAGRVRPIHVMDREADFYELFDLMFQHQYRYVVRMAHDRHLGQSEEYANAFAKLRSVQHVCERMVPLSPRKNSMVLGSRAANPPRNYRLARLAFSAVKVRVRRPNSQSKERAETLDLNIVHAYEIDTPVGVEPIDWKLITTEPIETPEQILNVVDIYRKRWLIEEYFKAIKTGCSYETRQLESKETLLNALAICIPIACRLLLLRAASRDDAESPASAVIDEMKIKVLRACSKKELPKNLTAENVLMAIAALGGHIKNNGKPGWMVLWRGYKKLLILEEGWLAATKRCDQS